MDYQSNSNKSKKTSDDPKAPERVPQEKVVSGKVVVKEKTLATRFKNIFFAGDMDTAKNYVIGEVLLPAFRNLLWDALSKGSERMIFGDHGPRRPRQFNNSSRVQYNNPVIRRAYLPDQRPIETWARDEKSLDAVILESRSDADLVVERIIDIVDKYDVVSVADVYELIGQESSHIDNKWGWTGLTSIGVDQVREGYRLKFPPLEEI